MKGTKLNERFFDSTRGRLVVMLRDKSCTVEELAEELELTDNAVRAHLATLERDGLVERSGIRRAVRKPHYTYVLTPQAENLFPKAYDALLNQLLSVLKERLAPEALEEDLREVGRAIARQNINGIDDDLQGRLEKAVKVLEALGGSPAIQQEGEQILIRSGSCPLAAAVTAHPEICRLAETLVAEILGVPVRERCQREPSPRCSFEVKSEA